MEEKKKKIDWNSESNLKIMSCISFIVLCFSMVAKDYYQISATINTLPYYSNLSIDFNSINAVMLSVMVFMGYAILYSGIIEILSRFVGSSIIRVSFKSINKYRFITIFKLIVAGANFIMGCFNFMYFDMPFTFSLQPIIEMIVLSVTFAIIFAICYKKYLNKKSAPVIFLSMALPLSIYFIVLAI